MTSFQVADNVYVDLAASNLTGTSIKLSDFEEVPALTADEKEIAFPYTDFAESVDLSTLKGTDLETTLPALIKRTVLCHSLQGVPRTSFFLFKEIDKDEFIKKSKDIQKKMWSQRYCFLMTGKQLRFLFIDPEAKTLIYSDSNPDTYIEVLDFCLRYPRKIDELNPHGAVLKGSYPPNYIDLMKEKRYPLCFNVIMFDSAKQVIKSPLYIDPTKTEKMKKFYDTSSMKKHFIGEEMGMDLDYNNELIGVNIFPDTKIDVYAGL